MIDFFDIVGLVRLQAAQPSRGADAGASLPGISRESIQNARMNLPGKTEEITEEHLVVTLEEDAEVSYKRSGSCIELKQHRP